MATMFKGINASEGIGIGTAVLAVEPDLSYKPTAHNDPEKEAGRYKEALEVFCNYTRDLADKMAESVGEEESQIILGHIAMAKDPFMQDEINRRITEGMCAEQAVDEACDMFYTMFANMEDALMRERAADVTDIRTGLLANLLGKQVVDLSNLPKDSVVVVSDLTPSMTADIDKKNVAAIVTETGGRTSHSAIIARALEIPAVLSVQKATTICRNGDTVIVEGNLGEVFVNPTPEEVKKYRGFAEAAAKDKAALDEFRGKPTETADGLKKILVANIGNPDDANGAIENDAEGIGLFRSEFLFMDSKELPSEAEQFEAYQKVALRMKGKPVIIRTLDVGGDKEIPYMNLTKEENPFMGYRAIRYCLDNPEQYKVQLRALLHASSFGDVKIMVPLITSLDELRRVKALVQECKDELRVEGVDFNDDIEIGVMIETPAASLIADDLAAEADFFSIGTNDLTGYTMCADRGNDKVANLYNPFYPAVLRSIQNICRAANEAHIMVGMCGEAAADVRLIPLLIAFGLDEFSVGAPSVLRTRKTISNWTVAEAKDLAEKVMALKTVEEVEAMLDAAYKPLF